MAVASAPANRRPHSIEYEGMRAMLALAGIRMLSQAVVTGGGANSDNTYPVVDSNTRRVIILHNAATFGNIRFNMNAAATVNSMPIVAQRYFVVDARGPYTIPAAAAQGNPISVAGDIIHFFDVAGGTVVNFMEVD